MTRLKYQFTLDDMPLVAEYMYRTYQRDHDDFEHYSSDFNQEFEEALEERINAIRELPDLDSFDRKVAEKQKKLLIMTGHLRPLLNITEIYLRRSDDVDKGFDDKVESINALRDGISERHFLEVQSGISRLIRYIVRHLPELTERGFPERIVDDFRLLSKNLQQMEVDLAETIHEKEVLTSESVHAVNDLWEVLEDIWNACPDVFSRVHPEKARDYLPDEIKRHIHHKSSYTMIQ
jgi:hypothetical protein